MSDTIFIGLNNSDKKFEKITFNDMIFEKNIDTERDISFIDCTFKNTVAIDNLNARELTFINCKFEKQFYLINSSFAICGFTNCRFSKEFNLSKNKCTSFIVLRSIKAKEVNINGEYNSLQIVSSKAEVITLLDVNVERLYDKSKIEFLVKNQIGEVRINTYATLSNISFVGSIYKNVFFEGTFEEVINFDKDIKIDNLYFESSTFKKRIDIQDGKYEYVNFYRSSFHSLVLINDFDITNKGARNLEIKSLTIHSCIFEMDYSLQLEKIEYLNLSNNNFKQIFYFNNYNSKPNDNDNIRIDISGINQGNIIVERVNSDLIFHDINIGNILFKDMNTREINMTDFQNNGSITFSNIKSGKYFIAQNSIIGNLNFLNFDINIFDEIVIADSDLIGVNFDKYPNHIRSYSKDSRMGYGIENKSKNNSNLRKVYNQLKHITRNKGDIDMSNKFQSLEYQKLLLSRKISFDSILLILNWASNNNGRSWSRGVLFTLIVAFIFFKVYLFTLGIKFSLKECYTDYVVFITSFPKLELNAYYGLNNNWKVKLVIWLSRIFISYGIYQTIAAFRKYGNG